MIRLPATGPAPRIGSLVVNPGGPGGSGVQYALRPQRDLGRRAGPVRCGRVRPARGGWREPAVHCLSGAQLDRYFATSDTPGNTAQRAAVVSESKLFARGCEQESGPCCRMSARPTPPGTWTCSAPRSATQAHLPRQVVRHLPGHLVRAAVPGHVRALVLDGAVDPGGIRAEHEHHPGAGVPGRAAVVRGRLPGAPACPLPQGGDVTAAIARVQSMLNQAVGKPLGNLITGQPATRRCC